MVYAVKKNGKFVREFSEGMEFTGNKKYIEYYRTKRSAVVAASEYGRKNGGGYSVVEIVAPAILG